MGSCSTNEKDENSKKKSFSSEALLIIHPRGIEFEIPKFRKFADNKLNFSTNQNLEYLGIFEKIINDIKTSSKNTNYLLNKEISYAFGKNPNTPSEETTVKINSLLELLPPRQETNLDYFAEKLKTKTKNLTVLDKCYILFK